MKFEIAIRLIEYGFGVGFGLGMILIALRVWLPPLISAVREAWNEPMEFEDDPEESA